MATQQVRNATWKCLVQTAGFQFVEFGSPLTVDFTITKSLSGQTNSCVIRIYNVNQETSRQIEFDKYVLQNSVAMSSNKKLLPNGSSPYKQVVLFLGYKEPLTKVFTGNLMQAFTEKSSPTDVALVLQVADGQYGFLNSITNKSFASGSASNFVFNSIAADLQKIQIGHIDPVDLNLPRGLYAADYTMNVLKDLAKGNPLLANSRKDLFVDNETLHCLSLFTGFGSLLQIPLFDASNLYGTPYKTEQGAILTVDLYPDVALGDIIQIESRYNTFVNGTYKIQFLEHKGSISDAHGSDARTTIQGWMGLGGSFNIVNKK